jgi:hypothetical protein
MALLWGVGLSPHPHSQPLLLFLPLFIVWLFAPFPFSGAGLVFHPTPTVGVRLQFAIYAFQFCWGRGFQSAQALCWIMFWWGWVKVVHVANLLCLQVYPGSFEASR